jgi:iron complex outermembrane receptor protein
MNQQRHNHRFGDVRERDRHKTAFGEVAVRSKAAMHTWVIGTALEREAYDPRDVPRFAYAFNVPAVFAQDDVDLTRWMSISASGRFDHHSEYGGFFSPRISALMRGAGWTARASAGTGFFGPTVLTEETEAAGLSRLVVPAPLRAERGRSLSVDIGRSVGPAALNLTVFNSRIRNPLHVERTATFTLSNLTRPLTNRGVELLTTVRQEPIEVAATYTYVRSREYENGSVVDLPLTPRHSVAAVIMIEAERRGRVGIEGYYTGRQRLDDNPYRLSTPGYVLAGFLAEWRLGRVRLFLNAENLTNVRQTRWDPLLRPEQSVDGRWTVEEWVPLEGRVVNGGLRLGF